MEIRKQLSISVLAIGLSATTAQEVDDAKKSAAVAIAAARSEWLELRRELAGKGFPFELEGFNQPAIPDGQNFAAHPIVAELFDQDDPDELDGSRLGRIELGSRPGFSEQLPHQPQGWRNSVELDLPTQVGDNGLLPAEAAEKIIAGLDPWKTELDELATAAKRPGCRYPIDWSQAIAPTSTAGLFRASRYLGLRAVSQLRSGNHFAAANDTLTILRISRHGSSDPSLLGDLLASAQGEFAYQCIWEGLKGHQWTAGSLLLFESELRKLDRLTHFSSAIPFELGFIEGQSSDLLEGKRKWDELYDPAIFTDFRKPTLVETYRTLTNTIGTTYRVLLRPSPGRTVPLAERLRELDDLVGEVPASTQLWQTHHTLGTFRRCGVMTLRHQANLNNTRIAIALERFRLKHGKLPARLDGLSPDLLPEIPSDPITGKPPQYKIRPDGSPAVYSIGWDGDDDGGTAVVGTDPKGDGDWVWQALEPGANP